MKKGGVKKLGLRKKIECLGLVLVLMVNFWSGTLQVLAQGGVDKWKQFLEKSGEIQETVWELNAILVEEELMKNLKNYPGLRGSENGKFDAKLIALTISDRVKRYANNIQSKNPYTKAVIIEVKKDEDPYEIFKVLQKYYLEGDGTLNEKNKLTGIVLIGDVPLPVVNKNGFKFISMYPYVDLVNPAYIFSKNSNEFIYKGSDAGEIKAEIWHGVIVPPKKGEEGNKMLAEYLDKNHLYHQGVKEFKDFSKKVLYSDFEKEKKQLNSEGMNLYKNYLNYWEDISYARYNKHWAKVLMEAAQGGSSFAGGDGIDQDDDGKVDEDPVNGFDDDNDGENGSPLFGLVDGVDNDGDGVVDNDEEGVYGFCAGFVPPAKGKVQLMNCKVPGKNYKSCPDGSAPKDDYQKENCNFYNVIPGSFYKITDYLDNDNDGLIDEGVDEDPGDAFEKIDNDRDGRIDEDTSFDNDADGDGKVDEDDFGDMNGDGCPGTCGVDEDNDSIDGDYDFYPDGYEKELGGFGISIGKLPELVAKLSKLQVELMAGVVKIEKVKEVFADLNNPTDPKSIFSFPTMGVSTPLGLIGYPRIYPFPLKSLFIDEGNVNDDDEDGKVDEDGVLDNDNDQDEQTDEDPTSGNGSGANLTESFSGLPDIQSKALIDPQMKKYVELLEKYIGDFNDWVDNTGRYYSSFKDISGKKKSDADTVPKLISIKDETVRIKLKDLNDRIEKRIDEYVKGLESKIIVPKGVNISGKIAFDVKLYPDLIGKPFEVAIGYVNGSYVNEVIYQKALEYINLIDLNKGNLELPKLIKEFRNALFESLNKKIEANTVTTINGLRTEKIETMEMCSLYRGSISNKGGQIVEAFTLFDPNSDLAPKNPPTPPESWINLNQDELLGTEGGEYKNGELWKFYNDPNGPMQKYLAKKKTANLGYAGCFAGNMINRERCLTEMASRSLFSLGGAREIEIKDKKLEKEGHLACYDFREMGGLNEYMLDSAVYLERLSRAVTEEDKFALDQIRPKEALARRNPREIKLIDWLLPPKNFFDGSKFPFELTVKMLNEKFLENLPKVTLEDVLVKFYAGDLEDNNEDGVVDDPLEANEPVIKINELSGNIDQVEFFEKFLLRGPIDPQNGASGSYNLKFGPGIIDGVSELSLIIEPIYGQVKEISTISFHKEPTLETLIAQTFDLERNPDGTFVIENNIIVNKDGKKKYSSLEKQWEIEGKYRKKIVKKDNGDPVYDSKGFPIYVQTGNALSIPIDKVRYVTFRDIDGEMRKIVYPNVFEIKDLKELENKLAEIEASLAKIKVNPNYKEGIFSKGAPNLKGYLSGIIEEKDGLDIKKEEIQEMMEWRDMSLDQKHAKVFKSGNEKGHEIAYIVGKGDAEKLEFGFGEKIAEISSKNIETKEVDCKLPGANCPGDKPKPNVNKPIDYSEYGADKKSMMPVFLLEWFKELKKWLDETKERIAFKKWNTACSVDLNSLETASGAVLDGGNIQNNEALPDLFSGEKASTGLKLEMKKGDGVVKSGDNVELNFKLVGENGMLNTAENIVKGKLFLQKVSGKGEVLEILGGKNEIQIVNGIGNATLIAKSAGEAKVWLVSEKGEKSNEVLVNVTDKKIRISSFRTIEAVKAISGGEAGQQLFDEKGELIAEIDGKSGGISLKKVGLSFKAMPADESKMTRILIINEKGDVKGMVYYLVERKAGTLNKVLTVPESFDLEKRFNELKSQKIAAVIIRNVGGSANVKLEAIDKGQLNGGVYLVRENGGTDKKIGVIDSRGGIYLSDGLGLTVRGNGEKPMIFEIREKGGKILYEVLVLTDFAKVKFFDLSAFANWLSKIFKLIPKAMAQVEVSKGKDSDGDGLTNLEEFLIGTNSTTPDTDKDGVSDKDEIELGMHPLKVNSMLFNDLKAEDKGFKEIVSLYKKGVFVAYEDGNIKPDKPISREEFIKINLGTICVLCNRFPNQTKEFIDGQYFISPFPDKDIGEEFKYCVREGKNRQIISGYLGEPNKGFYLPKANISRAEAIKVVLETARQQEKYFIKFENEDLRGKPWYFNYVLTAQKLKIIPSGAFLEADLLPYNLFKPWFQGQIGFSKSKFLKWLSEPITRREFAIMAANMIERFDCMIVDLNENGIPDEFEKYGVTNLGNESEEGIQGEVGEKGEGGEGASEASPDTGKIGEKSGVDGTDFKIDKDGDGLTFGDEKLFGSDDNNEDTDGGGLTDLQEYLMGLNPQNPLDDVILAEGGVFVSGSKMEAKVIYVQEEENMEEKILTREEYDRMPADGKSKLIVRAVLFDENDQILKSDNKSIVEFFWTQKVWGNEKAGKSNSIKFLQNAIRVKEGVAEIEIESKNLAGIGEIFARVKGRNDFGSENKVIEVYPLEPAKLLLKSSNNTLISGGLNSLTVGVEIYDIWGNIVNNGVQKVSLFSENEELAILNKKVDEDPEKPGVQVSTINGEIEIELVSGKGIGETKVRAELENDKIKLMETKTIKVRNDLKLTVEVDLPLIEVEAALPAKGRVRVVDGNGLLYKDIQGKVVLNSSNGQALKIEKGGLFDEIEVNLVEGEVLFNLFAGKKAGEILISASGLGMPSGSEKVKVFGSKVNKLEIILNEGKWEKEGEEIKKRLALSEGEVTGIRVVAKDEFGNAVESWTGKVKISIEGASEVLEVTGGGGKDKNEFSAVNGEVGAVLIGGKNAGKVLVKAQVIPLSKEVNIQSENLVIEKVEKISSSEIAKMKPNMLVAAILGSEFGDITTERYFAGEWLFSGKTQSVVSLTTNPKPKMSVIEIEPNGSFRIVDSDLKADFLKTSNEVGVTIGFRDSNGSSITTMKVVPPNGSLVKIVNSESEANEKGIFVWIGEDADESIKLVEDGGEVSVVKGSEAIARIFRSGRIESLNGGVRVEAIDGGAGLNLSINESLGEVARIKILLPENDVKRVGQGFKPLQNGLGGVYVLPIEGGVKFEVSEKVSGNSSLAPKGIRILDPENLINSAQAPGMAFDSLENAGSGEGVGFKSDNKFALFFSAGNSFGESNKHYLGDATIVLGDPTVKLNNLVNQDKSSGNSLIGKNGYTKDIGKMIYAGDKPIKSIVTLDVNRDGFKDILLGYENGEIKMLKNVNSGNKFEDVGLIIKFKNGIYDLDFGDLNNDGWVDLVIATKDSCVIGEVCVNVLLNKYGNFVQEKLSLDGLTAKNKVYDLEVRDMNLDSYVDLITVDDSGNIRIYYGSENGLDLKSQLIGNLGAKINSTTNLAEEVFIYRQGVLVSEEEMMKGEAILGRVGDEKVRFRKMSKFIGLSNSTKFGKDLTAPLNVVAIGDEVEYKLNLKPSNNFGAKVWISDGISSNLEYLKGSLSVCSIDSNENCKNENELTFLIEDGRLVVGEIDLNSEKVLKYKVKVKESPKLVLTAGNGLSDKIPVKDDFPDIGISSEVNVSGRFVYFYSNGLDGQGQVIYSKKIVDAKEQNVEEEKKEEKKSENPVKQMLEDILLSPPDQNGVPSKLKEIAATKSYNLTASEEPVEDGEYDTIAAIPGIGEAYMKVGKALDKIGDSIENLLNKLTCRPGCLPLPINYAFFAPGPINNLGVVAGFDPGTPLVGFGVPVTFVCAGQTCYVSTIGRIYLSPTLTGGIVLSTCVGPYPVGSCWSFPLPVEIPFYCDIGKKALDEVAGVVNKVASKIQEGVDEINEGARKLGIAGNGKMHAMPNNNENVKSGGFESNADFGSKKMVGGLKVNFRIPGFPSVITNWIDRQIDEVVNKLLDLPDIYVFLPDVVDLGKKTVKAIKEVGKQKYDANGVKRSNDLQDILTDLNRIPLLKIETKEVAIKIPALSPGELAKLINDYKLFLMNLKKEYERVKNIWRCGYIEYPENSGEYVAGYYDFDGKPVLGTPNFKTLCDIILLDLAQFIQSVEENIEILEGYTEIPRKILMWRQHLYKYLMQLTCYVDAILDFIVGNFGKWLMQLMGWVDAGLKVYETIMTWRVIADLVVNYQASCDRCTTSRFSLIQLLLRLFAFIPSPPVIPFPKWPDLYIDFSKIHLGLTIVVPDLRIVPEKLVLPRLPRIQLPELPNVKVVFPELPRLPDLDINLPEFPDLPPLPLPVLPNLPPPPKIPSISVIVKATINILEKIFRILCLIKKGLIPIPELSLKPHVEHITERSLKFLLPIDLALNFKLPEIQYEFLREIWVIFKLDLTKILRFDKIVEITEFIADKWNIVEGNLVEKMREGLKKVDNFSQNVGETVNKNVEKFQPKDIEVKVDKPIDSNKEKIQGAVLGEDEAMKKISGLVPEFGPVFQEYKTINKMLEMEARKMAKISEKIEDVKVQVGVRFVDNSKIDYELGSEEFKKRLARYNSEIRKNNLLAGATDYLNLQKGLLTYVEEMNNLDKKYLMNGDLIGYGKMIAKKGGLEAKIGDVNKVNFLAEASGKMLAVSKEELNKVLSSAGILDGGEMSQKVLRGIHVNNPLTGLTEQVVEYMDEIELKTNLAFADLDRDKDEELIYSYGGNAYLKMNFENNEFIGRFYGGIVPVKDFETLKVKLSAVSGLRESLAADERSEIVWDKVEVEEGDYSGYEVLIEGVNGLRKIILVKEAEGFDLSKYGFDEEIEIKELEDLESPGLDLEIENGFYKVSIRAFGENGIRSAMSEKLLITPTVCGDKQLPIANGGASIREVTMFKSLVIDGSKSMDAFGKVVGYYLDLDLNVDADLDGNKTNDVDVGADLNLSIDEDGDGIKNNDLTNPLLKVGPFNSPGEKEVMLNVKDKGGNIGQQKILIKVIVPKVNVDAETFEGEGLVGVTDPPEESIPVKLMRFRKGVYQLIKTAKAGLLGEYLTNENGKVKIDDLNLDDEILIKDKDGNVVARIDKETGEIIIMGGLSTEVWPAEVPFKPTRIILLDLFGKIVATIVMITEGGSGLKIDDKEVLYDQKLVQESKGVRVKVLNEKYDLKRIGFEENAMGGGVRIIEKTSGVGIGVIDEFGNVFILDENFELKLKETSSQMKYPIIELTQKGSEEVIVEILIKAGVKNDNKEFKVQELLTDSPKVMKEYLVKSSFFSLDSDGDGMPDFWELKYEMNPTVANGNADDDKDGLSNFQEYLAGTNPKNGDTDGDEYKDGFELAHGQNPLVKASSPFSDVSEDSEYYDVVINFLQRGILQGIPRGNQKVLGIDESITRAEFAKIMLDIFCIKPRPEALVGPAVFTDIEYVEGKTPWFYSITKEAYFQGFVTGYLGEIVENLGIAPFRPEESISRAEAVKVILEALESRGVIDLSKVEKSEPWFDAYIKVAQNLEPYVVDPGKLSSSFIITAEEAVLAEKAISRGDFLVMAQRVLTANDCSTLDLDGDGLPDFWEAKYELDTGDENDGENDADEDGLSNFAEYLFGLNPTTKDTDGGGVNDLEELKKGNNPLKASDDFNEGEKSILSLENGKIDDADGLGSYYPPKNEVLGFDSRFDLESGFYIGIADCTSCPCDYTLDHSADLINGDKWFFVIENEEVIYAKSEEVEF